jgi:magnesium transporter
MKSVGTRTRSAVGLPPGTLVFTGKRMLDKPKITYFHYNQDNCDEGIIEQIDLCKELRQREGITWINVDGLHDTSLLACIGEIYGLHPLIVEDIVQTDQRPKVEFFEEYAFITFRMMYFAKEEEDPDEDLLEEVISEQVSIVFGKNFVLSFQESLGDVFDTVRERIRKGKGRIRKSGPDYLAYALMDAVVDQYFVILEAFGDELEDLEDEILGKPSPANVQTMHEVKRELIYIRKSSWPMREVITALQRDEGGLINPDTRIYFRDLYDHTIQIIDTIEVYRDVLSSMFDIYLSTLTNKLNEVMKVLTIISTIFIPLTFIAGVYGMNFKYLPEVRWYFGYPFALTIMGLTALSLLMFFRYKRWI